MTELQNETVARLQSDYGTMMLNKSQAAKELNISTTQIDRLRKSGELKFKTIGTQIRIPANVIAELIA